MTITVHGAAAKIIGKWGFLQMLDFFSTRACVSGHQVCLAKWPRPSLHGAIIKKPLP